MFAKNYILKWEKCTKVERVTIRSRNDKYPITTTQRTKEEFTSFEGTFLVEIDTEAIAAMLINRAAHSKSGRSAFLAGMCKTKLLAKKALGTTRTKQYPVNQERYEIIAERADELEKNA